MNTSEHSRTIRVNRAPVLTLWATVVAERLGFNRDAALTLGRAVAGSSAQMKGRALGIYEPSEEPPSKAAEERWERLEPDEPLGVRLFGRTVPRPSRTWGVLCPPLAVAGRGHDAVADHAGVGRACRHAATARGQLGRAHPNRAYCSDAGPQPGGGQGGPGRGTAPSRHGAGG